MKVKVQKYRQMAFKDISTETKEVSWIKVDYMWLVELISNKMRLKALLKKISEEMNKIGGDNSCDMCEQGDYSECHGTFRWKHNDEVEEVLKDNG